MQAVTFDLWGTLFHEKDHQQVGQVLARGIQEILEREGWRTQEGELVAAMEECRRMVVSWQVTEGLDFPPPEQLIWILGRAGISPAGWLLEELHDFYTGGYGWENTELVPGAAEVLRYVSRHCPVALICNTGRTPGRVLRSWLQAMDLQPFFRTLIFSDEVRLAKPNPRLFHLALERLDAAPEQAAHIGDDLRTDIEGARRTGMLPVWLNRKGKSGCPEWALEAGSLRELPGLLGL